jgi:uncharacterized protein
MKLSETEFSGGQPIDSYGPGFFRISGTVITGNIFIFEDDNEPWEGFAATARLIALKNSYDVLFIGTGSDVAVLPAAFRDALTDAGVFFEAMSTPAACRTYNVLLSEGRRVAAALIANDQTANT